MPLPKILFLRKEENECPGTFNVLKSYFGSLDVGKLGLSPSLPFGVGVHNHDRGLHLSYKDKIISNSIFKFF